jgi:GNAT superfamily N-acetyltransferase
MELTFNVCVYSLRPTQPGDQEFLFRVYANTRAEEMALVDWTDEQKTAFLNMQFEAQSRHYRTHYPAAEYSIILRDGEPVGRLIMDRSAAQHLIIDIALLTEFRCLGIGTAILKDLMNEARQASLPLVLRVEFFNPAMRLYSRLGFIKTREVNSIYHEMVWAAESTQ